MAPSASPSLLLQLTLLLVVLVTRGHAVTNVTFTLEKTGSSANVTDMWVGTTVSFKLTVDFPPGVTDMLIELFAPDNDTIIMALCNVVVTKDSGILTEKAGEVIMDSLNGSSIFYDRAIIDFGNVTAGSGPNDNTIVITYEATMIHNDQTSNGTTYWVSAGAEYKNEDEVWVGQASFTAHLNGHTSSVTPVFNMTGPEQMPVGSAAVFTVDMYIPHPSAYITFDAFAPINTTDVMSVVGVKVKDTGSHYDCLFRVDQHVQTLYTENNTKGWARGHLALGVMTNRGPRSRTDMSDKDRITVEFVVWLDTAAPVGQAYWVGAAVEIGDTQIWCGQMQVTTLARYDTPNIVPTMEVSSSSQLSQQVPLVVTMGITLEPNSTSDYSLEVVAPEDSGQSRLKVCALTLTKVGENMPATTMEDKQALYSSQTGGTVADRAVLDLLRVSNVGDWGHQNATVNADNNVLTFSLVLLATNHSLNVDAAQIPVTVGLLINQQLLSVGTVNVTVNTALVASDNVTSPQWELKYGFGTDQIKIGSATNILFTVTTSPGNFYSPFDLEIIMPNSTTSVPFKVCSVRILEAGKNLPCLQPSLLNTAVSYKNDNGGPDYDRAVLNLDSVCNLQTVNSTDEDKLTISAIVQATADSTAGQVYWLSAGVMYSSTRMWIGQLAATAVAGGSYDPDVPSTYILENTTATSIYQGYGKVYTLHIKVPLGKTMPMSVTVDTSAVALSVCDLRLMTVGAHYPCIDVTAHNTTTYTKDPITGKVSSAVLDLGVVTNAGTGNMTTGSAWDDDTIQMQFVVKALATATTGVTNFNVVVNHGASKTDVASMTVAANPTNMTTTNISTVDMSIGPISGSDTSSNVAVGEAKRVLVDLYVPQSVEQPCQQLEVKMLAPLDTFGLVEVAYIGFLEAGDNFNCLHRSQTTASYLKRPHNAVYQDIGSLNLGVVCNTGASMEPLDNRVRVEAVVRVLRNESTTAGTDIVLSAGINTNNQEILIVQTSLHVADNFTDHYIDNVTLVNGTGLRLNVSGSDTLTARPGDVLTVPLTLLVPLYSVTQGQFDLECPLNTSAFCTFVDFRVLSSGTNLARWGYPEDYKVTSTSTMNTTQQDKAFVDLGILTNAGSTDRIGENVDNDNAISVELDVKVADALPMENNTEMWVSLGFKVAKYIVILDVKVLILRDGTEKPILLCQADVDVENSTSQYIEVDVILQHDNQSRAECQNASAMIYLPPYLAFASIVSANLTPATAVQNYGGVLLDYGSLYFTDVVALTLAFTANSSARMPEVISGARSVVTMETVCNMYYREGSQYTTAENFCSDMCHVNFSATVTKESGLSCTSTPLGLDYSVSAIGDCQLSSSAYSIKPATFGRLNHPSGGWSPFVRQGGLAAQRCFQVCLGHKTFVDKVGVQNSGPSNASLLQTLFSDDGRAWVHGEQISLDTSLPVQTVTLNQPSVARYMRLCVLADTDPTQQLNLGFELYGCNSSDTSVTDRCAFCSSIPSAPQLTADFSPRSFLVAGTPTPSYVLVCDGTGSDNTKSVRHACFKATIQPVASAVWKELDPRLDCMVGYDADAGELFATGQDGTAVLLSKDDGLTWNVTRTEKLTEAKAKTSFFRPAVKVPWTADAGLTFDGATPTIANDPFKDDKVLASFGGLWFFDSAWDLALNWTTCCS